ncbi:glycoside hydrolase family 15 protein [Halalkaliarchaeum desulfuricum]|nr:glycoside hydrolase family 15 protein [Halalkaliarchaeum desulfuricum]
MRKALLEYTREREAEEWYPGERRSTDGLFSGDAGRLVYVDRDGSLRDYSAATLGLHGIERSRLGVRSREGTTWFDGMETTRQAYDGETTVVVTEHDADSYTIHQYDYTLDGSHLTHFEFRGDVPDRARIVAAMRFTPDGQDRSTGLLRHEDVVELFHDAEHDYVTASTGFDRAVGHPPGEFDSLESFDSLWSGAETVTDESTGSETTDGEHREYAREENGVHRPLSDTVLLEVPLSDDGEFLQTTLVSLLVDHRETEREDALARVRAFADHYQTDRQIRNRAISAVDPDVSGVPHREAIRTDLRAISLLTARTGARIKGPEYDPYHVHSGGYGYTWFRDDAAIARRLLALEETFGLDLGDRHADACGFYRRTQLPDGSWPQRVWAHNGSLAPGWANDRVSGEGRTHQPDGTAAVTAFLATYLRTASDIPERAGAIEGTIERAVEALVDDLDDDGLPGNCQGVWETEIGRFTHTAAAFLEAFSAVARAPVDEELAREARRRADGIYEGLDDRWLDEGRYARKPGDDRFDVATLALVGAHREYAALVDGIGAERLDRLRCHVETAIERLRRDGEDGVAGLARYEGDDWRRPPEADEKLWPLAVAWAGEASADLGVLLESAGEGDASATAFERSRELLSLLDPDGPLSGPGGSLPEQTFDDGTPDSAVPFGWAHALRAGTVARLAAADAIGDEAEPTQVTGPAGQSTWTTGETHGVGTACDHDTSDPSRVWFTLTEGALTEPRFPRVDLMNFRTIDFLVVEADPESTYTARTHNETRTDDDAETISRTTEMVGSEGPVYRQTIEEAGRNGHEWELIVEYVADPGSESLLLDVSFTAHDGNGYDVYVVGNAALSGYMRGTAAETVDDGDGYALAASETGAAAEPAIVDTDGEPYRVAAAIASRRQFEWATVDRSGSDALVGLFVDGTVPEPRPETDPGHAVLVGRLGTDVGSLADVVSVGFAEDGDTEAALTEARSALDTGYVSVRDAYLDGWRSYLDRFEPPECVAEDPDLRRQYRAAIAVLKAVEDKTFPGAGIASPSVPWGEAVDATEPRDFGYNFAWARDLYQVFTALREIGDVESAVDSLEYIYEYQQRVNGFLPQNTYLDGRTRWGGEQLDNISFPSVMAYQLAEHHGIGFDAVSYDYGNVRGSLEYLLRSGPRSGQERWEEEAGYSPSTIAAEIAGLACGATLADGEGERADALSYLAHADDWRVRVDDWCATTGTGRFEPAPYYVRITRNGNPDSGVRRELANNGPTLDEREIVDAGFLELVRLGIHDPDDPLIENSVAVVDDAIRAETPHGPAWYRYNGDGYGEIGETEPDEGAPWGTNRNGSGRLWPIFTGERGEYELQRGTDDGDFDPRALLETMAGFGNDGRMLPEQVWDREYPTDYGWEFGEGTGAATPLAWSMAGFVRLAHSIDAGEPVETPRFLAERYREGDVPEGPSLSIADPNVDVDDDGTTVVTVSGETDGDDVVVWAPSETAWVPVDAGAFETSLEVEPGADEIRVIAASDAAELVDVGTTLATVVLGDGHEDR